MATLTDVEPFTPRDAMYATAKANTTATTIMNTTPGLEELITFGHSVPTRYPHRIPITPTITPG